MNINRLLENSKRTCLIGKNIYTYEGYEKSGEWHSPLAGLRAQPCGWHKRCYGICIGHEVEDMVEAVYPEFYENGNLLQFTHMRHRWTPAWQETYYRCAPDSSYYPNSGCISFCETKCITKDDVFCSHIVLRSDKRVPADILIKLVAPVNGEVDLNVKIGALCGAISSKGYASVKNTVSGNNEFTVTVPPNGRVEFWYSWGFSKKSIAEADDKAKGVLQLSNSFEENEKHFNDFMQANAPELVCDNPDIMKIYYYRWFLVYRAIHCPSEVIENHPIGRYCLYESPCGRWYGCPVGLPVPHHTEETKWMIKPDIAYDNIYNWIDNKTYYQQYIQYTPLAIWHMYQHHPDISLIEKAYPVCREFTLKRFDIEKDGLELLPTLDSSWPTGAEYQPAFYQHTKLRWDWTQDMEGRKKGIATEPLSLYRLDDIVYSVGNVIGCIRMAELLGKTDDCSYLKRLLEKTVKLIKTHFWSQKRCAFVSRDANADAQCDEALCYDSFMPFLWNIVGEEYLDSFDTLLSEDLFGSDFGITSADKQCPMYWFDNCIAGPANSSELEPHPYGCSWNGPVWPYAVCMAAEALGSSAVAKCELREKWIDLFDKYTELHFLQGDRALPMVTEHYRPTDGWSFSKTCDYFHSTWIDLFMKYWAGIQVSEKGVEFLPFAKEKFVLKNVRIANKSYTFSQKLTDGKYICTFDAI